MAISRIKQAQAFAKQGLATIDGNIERALKAGDAEAYAHNLYVLWPMWNERVHSRNIEWFILWQRN